MATGKATIDRFVFTSVDASVFDTVEEQRNENYGEEPFIFSVQKALETLKNNGNAVKYGIGAKQIRDSIHKMANNKILDADWIVSRDSYDPRTYTFAHHDAGYMYRRYRGEIIVDSDEERGDEECEDWIFIDVTFARIKAIRDNCVAKYSCSLLYDDTEKRFVVKCKELGTAYIIKRINYGGRAAEVFRIALAKSPNPVTRGDLKEEGINVMKISIATRVFDDNSIVRNELSSFVKKMTSNSIAVRKSAILTLIQLKAIEKASF